MTTNKMLQNDDTTRVVLTVAIEISLKTRRLAMGAQGGTKQRHKNVDGGAITRR